MNRTPRLAACAWVSFSFFALPIHIAAAPLFDSQETLEVIIEAPLQKLSRQRHKNPQHPGTFRFTDLSGREHSFVVNVTTRGKSRLEVCDYPPLKITFDPQQVAGTLFDGQHKLKLVRQCMRGGAGRDWVHLEFGIYRAYSVITDYSFLARRLSVTFIDTESGGHAYVQPGFFLEDDRNLARRLSREKIRPPKVDPTQLAAAETSHDMLFQYLIGNTDFAVKRGPSGEGCCHNGRVFAQTGKQLDWVVVPYDFDYAGIVNTKYAAPAEALPIKRVTTRLYRGFCWHNDALADSIELFKQKRNEIEAALVPSEVSGRKSRNAMKYTDRFYEIINDSEELKNRLLDKCRGPDSLPLRESPVSPEYANKASSN